MKRTPKFQPESAPILAFGAHPDDIEFGCGGVIALEAHAGRSAHFVVCSLGESATNGTPARRKREAQRAAQILGATVEFVELDGDAHLEIRSSHIIKLAKIIRRLRPAIVLAPTLVDNQHPDHPRLGHMVRDATRLARYGGVKQLLGLRSHSIEQLLFYAISPEAEPSDISPLYFDISDIQVMTRWADAMQAHESQMATRNYAQLQVTRARLCGLRAGVDHAIALYPSDPPTFRSLSAFARGWQPS